jgi:hypothetical protein
MSDQARIRFGTRHLFWLMTLVCVFLGIPGLIWVLFPFAAAAAVISIGAIILVVAIVLELGVIFLIPPLRRALLDPPDRFRADVARHTAARFNRETDA